MHEFMDSTHGEQTQPFTSRNQFNILLSPTHIHTHTHTHTHTRTSNNLSESFWQQIAVGYWTVCRFDKQVGQHPQHYQREQHDPELNTLSDTRRAHNETNCCPQALHNQEVSITQSITLWPLPWDNPFLYQTGTSHFFYFSVLYHVSPYPLVLLVSHTPYPKTSSSLFVITQSGRLVAQRNRIQ